MENPEIAAGAAQQEAAKQNAPEMQGTILVNGVINDAEREAIYAKIKAIKEERKLKRVFAVVVYGDDEDSKPFYVGYFKRPDMPTYSRFMMKVQEDQVQASQLLAQSTFVDGDREIIDDPDIFVFGTMNKLTPIIEGRGAELVKLPSVGK